MRVPYTPPNSDQFDRYFNPNYISKGAGLSDIRVYKPHHYVRGGSIFSFLSGVFKRAIPFLRGIMLPELNEFTRNFTTDVENNVPLRDNLKRNLIKSAKNVGKRIVKGGGKRSKKKNKVINAIRKKRGKNNCVRKNRKDIFDHKPFDF